MPKQAFSFGIDIGGTAIKGAVLLGKRIVKKRVIDSPKTSEKLFSVLKDFSKDLKGDMDFSRAGIALAGTLDAERKNLLIAPNMKALRVDRLRYHLTRAVSAPVVLENDSNAAAWAEYVMGAGRNINNFVLFALGTGLGGGIIINGKLWTGSHGMAGELGHIIVRPDGALCSCKQRGCLEAYASLHFLRRNGIHDSKEGLKRARAGKRRERRIFFEMGRWLGIGMVSIANMIDPEAIIIGGGLSGLGSYLIAPAKAELRKSPLGHAARNIQIKQAELGRFGGAIGAALLSMQV